MSARYDAIVIGAGVAGSAAAIRLAAAGWCVALVEKHAFPRRKVCGECVAATNLELLDALGVGSEFAARAGPALERVAVASGADTVVAALPRLAGGRAPFGRALGRDRLDTLLIERARTLGAALWQPWTLRALSRSNGLHECRLAAQSGAAAVLQAPVVIDARGSWEPAVQVAGAPGRHPARASDLLAFKATFRGAALAAGVIPVLAFRGGYGGMVIEGDGLLTLACCIWRSRLRDARRRQPGAAGAAVQRLLEDECAAVRAALRPAERLGPWLAVGPIRPGVRRAWTEQGGFAAGNAAGEAHPILGEGISMALQSAWLLTALLDANRAELLDGRAQSSVGKAYARAWRRAFAARVRWAAALAHLAMRPAAARPLLPLLKRWPELLTAAAVLGGKTRPAAVGASGSEAPRGDARRRPAC
jgi:flavin-dependent dehydrogenase